MINKLINLNMNYLFKNRSFIFLTLVLIVLNLNFINSCYITNCPWGGKRTLNENDYLGYDMTRQCHKCASGLGTCFGPRICCGLEIGCLVDTKETLVCRLEDVKSSVPCTPYGKSCNKVEYGKCATPSLCCNPDHCMEDLTCSQDDQDDLLENSNNSNEEQQNKELDRKLLKALSYLIEKQNHQQSDPLSKLKELKSNTHQLKIENDK